MQAATGNVLKRRKVERRGDGDVDHRWRRLVPHDEAMEKKKSAFFDHSAFFDFVRLTDATSAAGAADGSAAPPLLTGGAGKPAICINSLCSRSRTVERVSGGAGGARLGGVGGTSSQRGTGRR